MEAARVVRRACSRRREASLEVVAGRRVVPVRRRSSGAVQKVGRFSRGRDLT